MNKCKCNFATRYVDDILGYVYAASPRVGYWAALQFKQHKPITITTHNALKMKS